MRTYQTVLIFFLLVFILACENEQAEPVNTIGSEIEFSMNEYMDAGDRVLTFKFLTKKDYPCINYGIKHQMIQDEQSIRVVLEKVETSELCLKAIGPATAFVDIRDLPAKDYELIIQVGESIINEGKLHVSKQSYEVTFNEYNSLTLLNDKINRVPERAIWGTIRYLPMEANKELFSFFKQASATFGANEAKFATGDYGYFQVGADGKILQNPPATEESLVEKPFLLEFTGDEDDLSQLIEQLKGNFEQFEIRLYTTQGREFTDSNLK
ncbi:MAG: hypothetical protein ACLFUB_03200 [Cyclobacteriaceae bacterium]